MYGVLLRAGPQALMISLMGTITTVVLSNLTEVMLAGPATQDNMLIKAFTGVHENFVLIGIIALALTVLATATVEAGQGGV